MVWVCWWAAVGKAASNSQGRMGARELVCVPIARLCRDESRVRNCQRADAAQRGVQVASRGVFQEEVHV
jgi:hypothetical protein